MPSRFRFLRPIHFAALFGVFLLPALGQAPDPKPDEKKKQPLVRFICVSALTEDQKVVLASRDPEGKWLELGSLMLRSSFITEWLPAKPGELHLAVREGETLKSIGHFTYPADGRRAMAVLLPNPEKKIYDTFVVDPEKIGMVKGSVLAVNFSKQTGLLLLGTNKVSVPSGQRVVAKPTLEANGMYRLMVAYQDAQNKPVPCYDRYLVGNPDSRDMLFLFPDKTLGLRIFSLPIFGELD
jgi:hypothetical protein